MAPTLIEEAGLLSLHFGFPTIQSCTMLARPERLVLDYTRTMMGFLLFPAEPQLYRNDRAAAGSLAKYCHCKLPETDFTAIELSPEVIALRENFGVPDDDRRFRVICDDGANYIRGRGRVVRRASSTDSIETDNLTSSAASASTTTAMLHCGRTASL